MTLTLGQDIVAVLIGLLFMLICGFIGVLLCRWLENFLFQHYCRQEGDRIRAARKDRQLWN